MPSRNHHFIPKFYLKQWAVLEDQLREWTSYNKTIIPRWRYPDATGWQRDLYSFNQLPPEQAQYFDDVFLQHADDLAAKALKKLLSGDSSPWTSMMANRLVAVFVLIALPASGSH